MTLAGEQQIGHKGGSEFPPGSDFDGRRPHRCQLHAAHPRRRSAGRRRTCSPVRTAHPPRRAMLDPTPPIASEDAAERFWRLCEESAVPDVDKFLAEAGEISLAARGTISESKLSRCCCGCLGAVLASSDRIAGSGCARPATFPLTFVQCAEPSALRMWRPNKCTTRPSSRQCVGCPD